MVTHILLNHIRTIFKAHKLATIFNTSCITTQTINNSTIKLMYIVRDKHFTIEMTVNELTVLIVCLGLGVFNTLQIDLTDPNIFDIISTTLNEALNTHIHKIQFYQKLNYDIYT